MNKIEEKRTTGRWRLVEVTLELSENARANETFAYFKKLEEFIKKNFVGVMDLKCEKRLYENKVRLRFFHCGYTGRMQDPELDFFSTQLKIIK
jgi:hypothetical protein